MTWLQLDVLELLFESAPTRLADLRWPARSSPLTAEEARAAVAAERHLEAIRQPHPLADLGTRAFNHLF